MAEEDEDERIYTIPLRKTKNVPRPKRAPHAIRTIKQYVAKHMKSDLKAVWIDPPVNEMIWSQGIEGPPSKVRLRAKRVEEDLIEVTLPEE
ncbi:MAG: 50S ribosomal protein L31e [Thermoplasmata archaeon]|nr:MAG: 50S ribosomal protein L31e [Thermoplasmata archaeon]